MSRRFLRSLHEEHLEEIGSLYERRIGLLDDVEIDHDDLVDLESRLEAHLDALVVGAEPALELCAERALEADPGELFGALCVFLRQGRQDLFEAALARFEDGDDDEPSPADDPDDDDEPPMEQLVASAKAELGVGDPDDPDANDDEAVPSGEDDDEVDPDAAAAADDDDDDEPFAPTPAQALADALCADGPPSWQPFFERLLEPGNPAVVAAIARMMAVRGLRVGPKVVAAADRLEPGPALSTVLWSLGRARERTASPLLGRWAQRLRGDEAAIATLGMLRSGDPSILDFVLRLVPTHAWAVSLLAITGGPAVAPVLQSRLERTEVSAEDIIAAGLFGEPSMVPRLLDLLEGSPEATTQALYLITGAPVVETVVEPVEEAGVLGTLANGEPDPRDRVEVQRLAHDPAPWRQWWSANANALPSGRRHRLGRLASPEVLGQTLHRFVLRRFVRQLAAEELGLRYAPQRDLDVDQWVGPQRAALAGLSALRQSHAVIARADGAWVLGQALLR
ncbi:hypothetical protein [Paraliomyxa miuraensis]|uniref:hypothetical protein n=1 Tax=Paraliomyxa miuraensis TaxID=376150 RepID=UPI00224D51DD|nr:hypothetical protein [Paraliomyxa miuraensis]MCX4241406.1 hypothetical protein [Paraliomyxa miuraensis]